MYSACFLAFSTGFLSLSLEILWVRLFAYANHSMPQAFAFVLAMYLIGIALGAHIGKWFCKRSQQLWLVCGVALMLSSMCDVSLPWLYALSVFTRYQLWVGGAAIMLTALLKAIAFPIAHHLGTPTTGANVGRKVSRVYVSNIMGATLGPLFTGIFLLAMFTTQQAFVICAMLTLCLAMVCITKAWWRWLLIVPAIPVFVAMFFMNHHVMIQKISLPYFGQVIQMVENQYGIIAAYAGGKGGDVITGGNVYDGTTNLDPVINSNGINRVLVMAALVDQPKHVLMIGLSIGSWLKLVTSFPDVERIDVVEINPGYLEMIKHYPAQQSALLDPRVHLYIDDGRRWLKMHPEQRYDMVIMNATYHWRAYTGTILSQEFLRLVKQHMNDRAVLEYNTTGSLDVLKTASSMFKHAYLYNNFVIASDVDWRVRLRSEKARHLLAGLMLDRRLLFPKGSDAVIAGFLNVNPGIVEAIEPIYQAMGRPLEIITDDNLITEYKYGKGLGGG